MRIKALGVAASLAILPAIVVAQTPTPAPVSPPTRDSTKTTTEPVRDTAGVAGPTTNSGTNTTGTNTNTGTSQTTTGNSSTGTNLNATPTNPINGTNSGTTNSGTSTGLTPPTTTTTTTVTSPVPTTSTSTTMSTGTMNTGDANASVSSSASAPATGSAFAMGTHSAARDSMVGPRPEPPGDGTTCPWGCPTSRGTAGLTGPQFLALQQELRDRKCGNSHVTGRLDAATRTAIRNCARKMGVANNAAAVLVGFDIGFSSSDVNTSGSTPKQEE